MPSDSFLAFLGALLHIERAILYVAVAQAATAAAILVLALIINRRLR